MERWEYDPKDAYCERARLIIKNGTDTMMPGYMPYEFEMTPKEELLAARSTAWISSALSMMGSFDVYGPDAIRMLNENCVNRDFAKMKIGGSRHAVMADKDGWMIGSSVLIRVAEDRFRSYCLYSIIPVAMSGAYDVKVDFIKNFLFQVDGPKSLEIIEAAFETDFHDLGFAKNKYITYEGDELFIHRLSMSGALGYEVHGDAEIGPKIFKRLLEAGEQFGLKMLGTRQYMSGGVHTPGGFPNDIVNHAVPGAFDSLPQGRGNVPSGSCKENLEDYYVTPFDVGWGNLINWDHEFVGKAALEKIAAEPHRTCVTLTWDRDDVGRVYAAGIYDAELKGEGIGEYNEVMRELYRAHADKVLIGDEQVGVAMGRCIDYHTNQYISLGFVNEACAELGTEVEVLWGEPGGSQYRIKAKVAPMPYYDGDWRNEHCDVMTMVPERPYFKE